MKRINTYISIVFATLGLLFISSCEQVHVNKYIENPPVIESFSPESAPIGSEIIISGESLNAVTKAFIGDVEMVISQKVSNTRLSIIAGAGGRTGKITLVNSAGKCESVGEFTYSYAVPSVNTSLLPTTVDMGSPVLLIGDNLSAVEKVFFTADGYEKGNEGVISEQSATEVLVQVPYVEADQAAITLQYYDGSTSVVTPVASAPKVTVMRYKPVFNTVVLERTAVGKTVTLTGQYLDKVDKILVNGFAAEMNKQPETLIFTVPGGDFQDGDTHTSLVAEYFSGNENIVLSEDFVVYVPFLKFWENITSFGHGKAAPQNSSFFSPETGMVYANANWKDQLDPIGFKYQSTTCSEPQVSAVTTDEYNSVPPYFYVYASNSGDIAFTSPANSMNLLKNFWIGNVSGDENRVPGGNNTCFGTPVMAFRALNEANAEEKAIIDQVRSQTLVNIDEATFPINTTDMTIGGVGVVSATGFLNDAAWAPGMITDRESEQTFTPNAVIMVMYYQHPGPDKVTTFNYSTNVKRIGFIHVTKMVYRAESGSKATLGEYTYNCYWQKYDYDYSKVQ